MRYGEVTTGNKPGTDEVIVTATPIEDYTSQYNTVSGKYTITLNAISPTVSYASDFNADSWQAPDNCTFSFPPFRITYKDSYDTEQDVTSHYAVKATVADADATKIEFTDSTITTNGNTGKVPITFSFTSKDGSAYNSPNDVKLTLTINHLDKITPKIIFPKEGDSQYWGNSFRALVPKVTDDYGNDLMPMVEHLGVNDSQNGKPLCIAWSTAKPDNGNLHKPYDWNTGTCSDWEQESLPDTLTIQNWGNPIISVYGNDGGGYNCQMKSIESPAYVKDVRRNEFVTYNEYDLEGTAKRSDYNWTVYCQIYPNKRASDQSASQKLKDAAARFNTAEASYPLHIMLRRSRVVLEPDPHNKQFTKGATMDYGSRFNVYGRHVSLADDPKFNLKKDDYVFLRPNVDAQSENVPVWYTLRFRSDEVRMDNFPGGESMHKKETINGVEYDTYCSTKGWGNDDTWKMTFLKTGDIDLTYHIYPWNKYWEGESDTTITFNVIDKVKPVLETTPDPIILYTTDTTFPAQPETTVKSVIGEDIKEFYKLTYTLPSDHGVAYDEKTGKFIITDKALTVGKIQVIVTATPKDSTITFNRLADQNVKNLYEEGTDTFYIDIRQLASGEKRFTWTLVNKQGEGKEKYDAYKANEHGALVITGAGVLPSGYSVDAVPGLKVKFGSGSEGDDWTAEEVKDEPGKFVVYGGAVQLDENGKPTGGTYYKLAPHTNGYLIVDGKWEKGNNIVVVSEDGSSRQSITASELTKGTMGTEWTDSLSGLKYNIFPYPLLAGKKYYLYNEGNGETYAPFRLHSINFLPAFITQEADHQPIQKATAFANGYAGALPFLSDVSSSGNESVEYHVAGYDKNGCITPTEDNGYESLDSYGSIHKRLGTIKPTAATIGTLAGGKDIAVTNHNALKTVADRMKVYATVKSNYNENVVRTPYYDLLIAAIPTFIVPDKYTPAVGEMHSTENYPTHIRAFFGGWKSAEDRPYYKKNDPSQGVLIDDWKTSRTDSVGANDRTIDNFPFSSFGGQNGTNEDVTSYSFTSGSEEQTYKVPCRGTYLRFEPEQKGTVVVYVLQNGMVGYGKREKADAVKNNKMKLNPVFITDETGSPVPLANWSVTKYNSNDDNSRAYTEAILRMDWNTMRDDFKKYGVDMKYETDNVKTLLKNIGFIPQDENSDIRETSMLIGAHQKIYDVAKELKNGSASGSLGYSVITKAYTRYSFRVKPGKTYFVFMNGSKLGNGGFAFLPDNWSPDAKADTPTEITLDEDGNDDFLKGNVDTTKVYNVKLYHKFTANKWNSLCLPFSINQTKFRQIFGENALAISFDGYRKNDTVYVDGAKEYYDNVARFTQHSYHWIVAGRPYIVLPGKDALIKTDDKGRTYIEIDSVSFERGTMKLGNNYYVAPATLTQSTTLTNKKEYSKTEFNFKGIYSGDKIIKEGDYFIGTGSDGEAKLYRATKQMTIKGYRAYLPITTEGKEAGAKISSFVNGEIVEGGNNTPTGIDHVFDYTGTDGVECTNSTEYRGVYDTCGNKVAESMKSMKQMPKGVYINANKKFVNK